MTQYYESAFRVELVAADGATRLGIIRSVSSLNTDNVLDEIGRATFTMWAADEMASQVTAGSYFKLYTTDDGYLGLYTFQNSRLSEKNGTATLTVNAWQVAIELSRQSVHFNRKYVSHDIAQVINELVCLAAGWSTSCDVGMGFTAVDYQGESIMNAVEELRQRFRQHYRMMAGFDRRLEFGNFGADSGVRLTGGDAVPSPFQDSYPNVVKCDMLSRSEDGEAVINRIIPLGSGQGVAQVTLEASTYAGTYAVQTGLNPDGSSYWYIQDATSIAAYGLREKPLIFSAVRPINNTDAGKENAANELHAAAEAHLLKFKAPTVAYDVSTSNCPGTLQVCDAVTLRYVGAVDGVGYLDVNELVYVLSIKRNRGADGKRSQRLTISTTSEGIIDDRKIMIETVRTAAITKLHPQQTPYVYMTIFRDYVGYSWAVSWKFTIADEITTIQRITLNFVTSLIVSMLDQTRVVSDQVYWSPVMWTGEGGNIGVRGMTLLIDGVDATAALGGPWSTNNLFQIDEEVDITDYVVNSPWGLYADHYLVFDSDTSVNGAIQLAGEAALNGEVGYSMLTAFLRIFGSIQPIISD